MFDFFLSLKSSFHWLIMLCLLTGWLCIFFINEIFDNHTSFHWLIMLRLLTIWLREEPEWNTLCDELPGDLAEGAAWKRSGLPQGLRQGQRCGHHRGRGHRVWLYSYLTQTGKHRRGSKGVWLYSYLTQTGKHRQGSKGVCLYSYLT